MDNFQIETAQNISISQTVAGIGERILAYLLDALLQFVFMLMVYYIFQGLEVDLGGEWAFSLIIGLPVFLYHLVWEMFWNGQTPGKAALQIRVVKTDGSRPVFSDYLVRWLLRIVDVSISSGSIAVVTILFNGKGQRLGDLAAGTTVISEKPHANLQQSLLMDLPEDYEPKYPQVTLLSDKDIENIKMLYRDSVRNANHNIINALSVKVSSVMDVTPQELPLEFLKRVLRDYSYYTQR